VNPTIRNQRILSGRWLLESIRRVTIVLVLAVLLVFVAGDATALNPQPEVPSKGRKIRPKALNPQPEVPSKQKKQKKDTGKKKPPQTENR
jgi:hypothetical protein